MGLVKNRWRKPAWRRWTPLLWICPFLVVSAVFVLVDGFSVHETAPAPEIAGEDCEVVGDEHELLVTGYCNCGKCCGWRKKWFFFGEPVYDYGNLRGTPKKVGRLPPIRRSIPLEQESGFPDMAREPSRTSADRSRTPTSTYGFRPMQRPWPGGPASSRLKSQRKKQKRSKWGGNLRGQAPRNADFSRGLLRMVGARRANWILL